MIKCTGVATLRSWDWAGRREVERVLKGHGWIVKWEEVEDDETFVKSKMFLYYSSTAIEPHYYCGKEEIGTTTPSHYNKLKLE